MIIKISKTLTRYIGNLTGSSQASALTVGPIFMLATECSLRHANTPGTNSNSNLNEQTQRMSIISLPLGHKSAPLRPGPTMDGAKRNGTDGHQLTDTLLPLACHRMDCKSGAKAREAATLRASVLLQGTPRGWFWLAPRHSQL